MLRRSSALLLLFATLAAGCGGDDESDSGQKRQARFTGEERAVADIIERLQVAGEKGDAAVICDDLLATELVRRLRRARVNCQREITRRIRQADDFALNVEAVKVTGATATATVRSQEQGREQRANFEFVREGTRWRILVLQG